MRSIPCWVSAFVRLQMRGWLLWYQANRCKRFGRWLNSTEQWAFPRNIRRGTWVRRSRQSQSIHSISSCLEHILMGSNSLMRGCFLQPSKQWFLSVKSDWLNYSCWRRWIGVQPLPRSNPIRKHTKGWVWMFICRSTHFSSRVWGSEY